MDDYLQNSEQDLSTALTYPQLVYNLNMLLICSGDNQTFPLWHDNEGKAKARRLFICVDITRREFAHPFLLL